MKKLILLLLIILNSFGYSEEELDRLIGIDVIYINDFRRYARGKSRERIKKELEEYRSIDEESILEHMLKRYKQPKWISSQTGRGVHHLYKVHFLNLFYKNYNKISEAKRLEIKKVIWGWYLKSHQEESKVNDAIPYKDLFYVDLPEVKAYYKKRLNNMERSIKKDELALGINRKDFYKELEVFLYKLPGSIYEKIRRNPKTPEERRLKALHDAVTILQLADKINFVLLTFDSVDVLIGKFKSEKISIWNFCKIILAGKFIYTEAEKEKIIDALISEFQKPCVRYNPKIKTPIKGLYYYYSSVVFYMQNQRFYNFIIECTKSENEEIVKQAKLWLKFYKESLKKKQRY